jgi:hypothetical protein
VRRGALGVLVVLAAGTLLAACANVDGTFPATSACPEEARAAGALPDLEGLVPRDVAGQAPSTVDSGWNCLPSTLGTYASHGVTRLEFGGATWDEGDGNGAVAAVFRTGPADPRLEGPWVEESYEQGARASRGVENVETRRLQMRAAGDVWRLDALNRLSLQTIVVWPHGEHVHVVLVASTVEPGASRDVHETRLEAAVAAAAQVAGDAPDVPAGTPGASAGRAPGASVLPSPA